MKTYSRFLRGMRNSKSAHVLLSGGCVSGSEVDVASGIEVASRVVSETGIQLQPFAVPRLQPRFHAKEFQSSLSPKNNNSYSSQSFQVPGVSARELEPELLSSV